MKPQLPRRKIPRARSGFGRPQCRPPECLEWGRKTSLLIFTFIIWFQILIVKRQSLGVYNAGPREEGKGTRHGASAGSELCFAFVALVLFFLLKLQSWSLVRGTTADRNSTDRDTRDRNSKGRNTTDKDTTDRHHRHHGHGQGRLDNSLIVLGRNLKGATQQNTPFFQVPLDDSCSDFFELCCRSAKLWGPGWYSEIDVDDVCRGIICGFLSSWSYMYLCWICIRNTVQTTS